MLLTKKFKSIFEQQVISIGLKFDKSEENALIASNHEKYLQLKAYIEHLGGSGRLAIGELLVIQGNIQKALSENPFDNKEELRVQKKLGNFTLYTEKEIPNQHIKLTHLHSLNTKIFKSDEYVVIWQKGSHDLIRKNPIFIEFLRGKISIDALFEMISSLDIPNGLYIQRPLGLGDPEKLKKWKKAGSVISIFSIISVIIIMILKYLMLHRS
ncbi:hypothetical protein [Aquimarina sp. SS2-1]|uniref:hypothetical protein n=1 Tax=Aquimarina besae TaxID=3342247 RepID=UPI00366AB723